MLANGWVTIQQLCDVTSEEIGGTVEQHYNRPVLESGMALLNTTTAGHSNSVIEIEPILSREICLSVS